jgi:hypothetical protein
LRFAVACAQRRDVRPCRTFPFDSACLLSRPDGADTIAGDVCRLGLELHTRAGAILLNFTSSLHSGFRFGLNRHNFATGIARRKQE